MMRPGRLAILALLLVLLAACGIEVPQAKADYVGHWQADGMSLLILRDGSVSCQRLRTGASIRINGPLQAFHGDDFEVGIGPMKTLFRVSSPPRKIDGSWRMTVDGVELTRVTRR